MYIKYDVQNLVSGGLENAPDKLRGEIGTYYVNSPAGGNIEPRSLQSFKILSSSMSSPTRNDQVLIPKTEQIINIYGRESEFRDNTQWRAFVLDTIDTDTVFEDHTYPEQPFNLSTFVFHNYHHPLYEDYSKIYDTNHLLNYNLMNYRGNNDNEEIKRISSISAVYDEESLDAPNSDSDISDLVDAYPERIENYSGLLSELDLKQRNIFHFFKGKSGGDSSNRWGTSIGSMPYHFGMLLNSEFRSDESLHDHMEKHKMSKFILQAIKEKNSVREIEMFQADPLENNQIYSQEIFDLTNIILTKNMVNFFESNNEVFLLNQGETNFNDSSNRFVNRVNLIKFLQEYRKILKQNEKNYKDILDSKFATRFRIGYKIEKYFRGTFGPPVQTNYISSAKSLLNFGDTQLKHGELYSYKIYDLIAVLGNYYSYSDLQVSNSENELETTDGSSIITAPDSDAQKKYRARVKVTTSPSLQIFPILIAERTAIMYDLPTPPPEVMFYNQMGVKNRINISLKINQIDSYDPDGTFEEITVRDGYHAERYANSKENLRGMDYTSAYFTGKYEIYRMSTPPKSKKDFQDNLVTVVDDQESYLSKKLSSIGNKRDLYVVDFPNATYEDFIQSNRKYYYMFRALTYHDAPSNPSRMYEVELVEDADESKLVVKEYKLPMEDRNQKKKSAKRLIKIKPNMEQLFLGATFEEPTSFEEMINKIGVEENQLFTTAPKGRKFKIRLTSKHTGKKMDINLTFKLEKSNFPDGE